MLSFVVLAYLGLICVSNQLKAQSIEQENILYLSGKGKGKDIAYYPVSNYLHNFILFSFEQGYSVSKREVSLYVLDKNLKIAWQSTIYVHPRFDLLGYYLYGHDMYVLLLSNNSEYYFIKYNLEDYTSVSRYWKSPIGLYVTHLAASDQFVFLGGLSKDAPAVYAIPMREHLLEKSLTSIKSAKGDIMYLDTDYTSKKLLLVLSQGESSFSSITSTYINQYDAAGDLIHNLKVPTERFIPTSFMHLALPDTSILFFGAYTNFKNKKHAQGVYTVKLGDDGIIFNRLYDFSYLKNFFKYLPEKKQFALMQKIQKRRETGRVYNFGNNISFQTPIVYEDKFVVSGQSFDLNVRKVSNNNTSAFSSFNTNQAAWNSRSNSVTEYKYSHLFALVFNETGKLVWDSIHDLRHKKISSYASLDLGIAGLNEEEKLYFLMESENVFELSTQDADSLMTKNLIDKEGNRLRLEANGKLMHWYENYFIYFNSMRNKEKAHFISKLAVR